MTLKLPKRYITFLAICMVAGPFIWLVLTEDGQRRSDLFLLHLLGHRPFNLAVANLLPEVDEEALLAQFSRIEFACDDQPRSFGDRRCAAKIGSFNGVPARSAELFWNNGQLKAVRIDYRGRWHHILLEELKQRYGPPRRDSIGSGVVLAWRFDGGMLLVPEALVADEPPVLMWVSGQG
ncbi:MAG: hypothetical protein VBE63_11155 [Lamprobacter sp.]|uniref:hypothetical protein n=1 Tax=Lamprobacter sp. TaxID=3100796 RepID=UPI002B25DC98|nr:hypothetical protein [Lamprobacter sp.]MEA3640489.1 hypothetical protein [Lamprobacter sp.]